MPYGSFLNSSLTAILGGYTSFSAESQISSPDGRNPISEWESDPRVAASPIETRRSKSGTGRHSL